MERAAEGDPWSSAVKPKIRSARPSVKCTSNQTSASTGGSGNVNSLESPVLQSPEIRLTRGYSEQFAQLIASEIVSQQQLAADAAEGDSLLWGGDAEGTVSVTTSLAEFNKGELPPSQDDIEIELEFQTNTKSQPESSEVEYYEFGDFKIDTRWVTYGSLGAVLIVCLVFLGLLFAALAGSEMTTREYFVGIDEIEWDYAPDGVDACHGRPFAYPQTKWTSEDNIITGDHTRIGTKYTKAVYREYTDSSFSTLVPRAAKWEHLGLLGPVIRAEVGDLIRVTLKNNARFPFSMHLHGGFGNKANEGIKYNDDTTGYQTNDDELAQYGMSTKDCSQDPWYLASKTKNWQAYCPTFHVKQSEQQIYEWKVDESSGPTDGMSSRSWLYQSEVGGESAAPH